MGVISVIGKAILIAVSFWLGAIVWAFYITPAMKFSFYVVTNETVYAIWGDTYPQALNGVLGKVQFFVWFIDKVPIFLVILGGILSGAYLVKSWMQLRYQTIQ